MKTCHDLYKEKDGKVRKGLQIKKFINTEMGDLELFETLTKADEVLFNIRHKESMSYKGFCDLEELRLSLVKIFNCVKE